jgi:hypothetical protein
MIERKGILRTAVTAGGLVVLAAMLGWGGDQSDASKSAAASPSAEPAAVAASSGQPAVTLRPDPFDAPAATAVADAQRSAAMAGEMGGGHGGHGMGTYRQVDAGRDPEAHQESVSQTDADLYVCPMHPEVTSKAPGTCPKCGMTLVKRKKG